MISLLIVGIMLFIISSQPKTTNNKGTLPEKLTSFLVLEILDKAKAKMSSLPSGEQDELKSDIRIVEEHYFGETASAKSPDLRAIARRWIAKG